MLQFTTSDDVVIQYNDARLVTYEGLPHHLTDAVPERCVDDVMAFLRWNFGAPNPRQASVSA